MMNEEKIKEYGDLSFDFTKSIMINNAHIQTILEDKSIKFEDKESLLEHYLFIDSLLKYQQQQCMIDALKQIGLLNS